MEDQNPTPTSTPTVEREEATPTAAIRQRSRPPSLSASEPSLRFPRPQGNRRLANWVSSSQPDIMSANIPADLTEESGLADSTYELITCTDTESQDGLPESVCSSDYTQGDDIHSLAGTEDMHDYEDEYTNDLHDNGNDHEYEHAHGPQQVHVLPDVQSEVADPDTDGNSDEEAEVLASDADEDQQAGESSADISVATIREKVTEAKPCTSAMEYAEKSLKAPSVDIPQEDEKKLKRQGFIAGIAENIKREPHSVRSVLTVIAVLLTGLLVPTLTMRATTAVMRSDVAAPTVTTTVLAPTSTITLSHTATVTVMKPLVPSPSTTAALLLPSPSARPSNKTEGKGICSVTQHSPREILVKIPQETKLSWLAKDSISIEVARGQDSIKTKFCSVDEGILIEIPRKEAHGILSVSVMTWRRPKVNETFAVDFGKTIVDQTLDWVRDFQQGVSGKVDEFLAQHRMPSVPDPKVAAAEAREYLDGALVAVGEAIRDIKDSSSQLVENLQPQLMDVREEAGLRLLRAQVNAKLWSLKLQRKNEEHDEYKRKAEAFVANQVAAIKASKRARDTRGSQDAGGLWSKYWSFPIGA